MVAAEAGWCLLLFCSLLRADPSMRKQGLGTTNSMYRHVCVHMHMLVWQPQPYKQWHLYYCVSLQCLSARLRSWQWQRYVRHFCA